jgi:hypothetical protein
MPVARLVNGAQDAHINVAVMPAKSERALFEGFGLFKILPSPLVIASFLI